MAPDTAPGPRATTVAFGSAESAGDLRPREERGTCGPAESAGPAADVVRVGFGVAGANGGNLLYY